MSLESTAFEEMDIVYTGKRPTLFWLIVKTSVLTILTLGIYRFWMKSRVRRYYWSAISPGGHNLEYLGTGSEKLVGFLIAVVILAIYLGIFQLILTFASLSLLSEFGGNLAFFAVIPLMFFAQYRARRYILARTRWRGIRFAAEPAAFGYAWRAMVYSVLSLVSLGLLYPLQRFRLEKYATDRTWFGDMKLEQGGSSGMLFRPWLWLYAAGLVVAAGMGLISSGITEPFSDQIEQLTLAQWTGVALIVLGYICLSFAYVHFQVQSFKKLTSTKLAGGEVRFQSRAKTGSVLRIYVLGGILFTLLMLAVVAIGIGLIHYSPLGFQRETLEDSLLAFSDTGLFPFVFIVIYFGVFLLFTALAHVVFIQPVLAHYASTLRVRDPNFAVDRVRQRARDDSVEAGGFADALDVGAAI